MSKPTPAVELPQSYAAASIPDPFQILGRKLYPFTLDHYDLMRRFGCAFVSEAKGVAQYSDLIIGVLICSMRPAEFLDFIAQPTAGAQVKSWGKKVGMWDFEKKAKLFQRYLKMGWQEPPHINKGSGGRGDWSQNVRITLMARLGYTPHDFSVIPLSKILSDYYKLAESDGVISLLTEEDLLAMDENDKAMSVLEGFLNGGKKNGRS